MNDKQLYEICLEDYRYPRYASAIKSYYGTMDDMVNLMVRLADNDWTRTRYRETIDAAEYYDLDNEITHTVAGQTLPILTPVQEVCRFGTKINDQLWNYTVFSGAVFPCYAIEADVCQILIRTETGYERCLRAEISGLSICAHGTGWTNPNSLIKGFPGMVTWDGERHVLNLFVSQAHYELDEFATASRVTWLGLPVHRHQ